MRTNLLKSQRKTIFRLKKQKALLEKQSNEFAKMYQSTFEKLRLAEQNKGIVFPKLYKVKIDAVHFTVLYVSLTTKEQAYVLFNTLVNNGFWCNPYSIQLIGMNNELIEEVKHKNYPNE